MAVSAEVLLLTWLLLGTRYKLGHWGGAGLALFGSSLLVRPCKLMLWMSWNWDNICNCGTGS